jgi:hypothetical protein
MPSICNDDAMKTTLSISLVLRLSPIPTKNMTINPTQAANIPLPPSRPLEETPGNGQFIQTFAQPNVRDDCGFALAGNVDNGYDSFSGSRFEEEYLDDDNQQTTTYTQEYIDDDDQQTTTYTQDDDTFNTAPPNILSPT